jgi:hypothetical protein
MQRFKKLQQGIYMSFRRNILLNPTRVIAMVMEKIRDVIKTYNPRVIVKSRTWQW